MMEEIRKRYWPWEFEEEEKWLNDMARQGKGLRSVSKGRYAFSEEEPGSYRYRVMALRHRPGSAKGREEILWEEENDFEYLGSAGRWAYFRRPMEASRWDPYEDAGLKRRFLKRLRSLLILVTAAELAFAFYHLFRGMVGGHSGSLYGALALVLVGMFLLIIIIQISGSLRWLTNQIKGTKKRFQ